MADEKRLDIEQKRPGDVTPRENAPGSADEAPVAPPFSTPHDKGDEVERPVVNPVTGGAL